MSRTIEGLIAGGMIVGGVIGSFGASYSLIGQPADKALEVCLDKNDNNMTCRPESDAANKAHQAVFGAMILGTLPLAFAASRINLRLRRRRQP